MAQKYAVELPLPGNEGSKNNSMEGKFISPKKAGLIPRSVRLEIAKAGKLPDAPSKELMEACVLLADISGFTALGEKLTNEHGDSLGAEKFATQMSDAISALVNVTHRYEGEVVKIAGDCLICTFSGIPTDPEDEGDIASFERAKECAIEMLKVIRETNTDLDLHGGLSSSATLQRIHLKELRGSSPRSNSARQRMTVADQTTMSRAEYERSLQRWFLIAGRPIKIAAGLLDKAKAGNVKVYGGITLTRDTNYADIIDEEEDQAQMKKRMSKRGSMIDTYTAELATCPELASSYIPPIVREKGGNAQFENERRRVVIVFLSLPSLAKESVTSKGVTVAHLNDVYSALRSVLAKFEGKMRDFLFEDKGCTMISCFGITQITEVDALRAVLFALEASSACSSLGDQCKIGISMGQCFTGICGHPSRNDFVVMGAETNMAARLMGKAALGKILVSERVYNATQNYIGYDMSNPMEVKGKDGSFRALCPFGRKAGAVRHKNQKELDQGVFVGREEEMKVLRKGLKQMLEEKKGGAYILEGLAGMGKSAIVWQLQRESIDQNVRFLMGTGSAIEKQTPFFAFSQILTAAANLSTSPSYGEVLALKFNYDLEEEDINALGIMLPTLARRDAKGTQLEHGRLEARAAQVCLKIFQSLENTIFVFEDAHWIDSQSWIMLQMVLPQLTVGAMVMIVTRPPNMISQKKAGGADQALLDENERIEDEWLEDDDRIKFSRILAALKENGNIALLELGTMDNSTMRELIAKTLDVTSDKVSDEFVTLMDKKAGGIPMYLSSMTNWLKERDMVKTDDSGNISFTGDINAIKFPNSIMDTVHERIDSLDDEAKVLIKVCSCFGFEFRQENLENVAPQFLSSQDPSHLQKVLQRLAARGLVVSVTGESVSKMMKFTHQIITECAHNLMLDSQRRQVHRAIVEEYENSSVKFEMDILAHHWLRSGEVDRGCDMLQNAAIRSLEIGAYKECVNSLSQAIAYSKGTGSKRIAYWMALLGYARWSYGDQDQGLRLAYDAMLILDDASFLPQERTRSSVEKLNREYDEMGDVPESVVAGDFDDFDRAKVLMSYMLCNWLNNKYNSNYKKALERFPFLGGEQMAINTDWYRHYCAINSFKQNNIDIWTQVHLGWAFMNEGALMKTNQTACRRIYTRLSNLSCVERLKPQFRSRALYISHAWYPVIAPEMIKNSIARLQESLGYIEGNLKYAFHQCSHLFMLGTAHVSLGNIKMFKHYVNRISKVKFDSEALSDQKAVGYEFHHLALMVVAVIESNTEKVRECYQLLDDMPKMFPNTSGVFPSIQNRRNMTVMNSYQSCFVGDFEIAEKLMQVILNAGLHTVLFPIFTQIEMFHSMYVYTILMLYTHHQSKSNPNPIYGKALLAMRQSIEMLSGINPGTYRCAMQAMSARITLTLKDRPFEAIYKKLKQTLDYCIELDCVPLDTLVVKCEIARWEGDIEALSKAVQDFETIEYAYQAKPYKTILEQLKSGELKAVDLSFVPEKPKEKEITDEEKLAAIEKELMDVKTEMKMAADANDMEGRKVAAARAKVLKKQKKELKKKIEKGNEGAVDQAKIDELRAKIADANARAMAAFDDDDDEAEEAATAEMEALSKELEALTGPSIPRKNLADAKSKDAFNTIFNTLKDTVDGKGDLGFNESMKYKFEDSGSIVIDGTSGAIKVSESDSDAAVTVIMSIDTFKKMQSKELEPMAAMGSGLMKIEGNMGLLMAAQGLMKAIGEAFSK